MDGLVEALRAVLADGLAKAPGMLAEALGTNFASGFEKARKKVLADGLADALVTAGGLTQVSARGAGLTPRFEVWSSQADQLLPFFTGEPKIFTVSLKTFIVLWRSR